LILAICAGALVVKILGQAIARPLVELASGTEAIGSGDLDIQVKVRSSDEIGVLARAFNSMSLNLKSMDSMRQRAESSLEQANVQLEQRIEDRTIKLKQANDQLMIEAESRQESEERVRLVLDSTVEGIFGLDLEGNCTFCNRACIDTLGYIHADELLGQNMHDLIHHTRSDGSVQSLQESKIYGTFRTGQGVHVDDEVLWKADGNSFPATYRSFPVRRDGQLVGSVVSFLDITEQMRVAAALRSQQAELTHAGRMSTLGEMAAGLAHELNQPLTAMSAFAEGALMRIERGKLREADSASIFKRIAEDAQRAGDIIRRLRNFVQKREATREQVDANDLVRDVHKFFASDAKEQGIAIQFELEDDLLTVEVDPIEIQQVLLNLVRNACDALERTEGGERSIVISSYSRNSDSVELVVEDSGPGISRSMAEQVFEPFYTSKADGLGIGMGICKQIISAHGGRMWIGRSSMGGASVHFELPSCQLEDLTDAT
jgi:two-component system sensor histidine kinase TtrS